MCQRWKKILLGKKTYKSKNPFSTDGCRSIKIRDIEFETEKKSKKLVKLKVYYTKLNDRFNKIRQKTMAT